MFTSAQPDVNPRLSPSTSVPAVEDFRQSTELLHREMRELSDNADLAGYQMRILTGDMAYVHSGIDSVNNVTSRGGLAWTAQIGNACAFGGSLRNLGPAGNAAAGGLQPM